MIKQTIDILLSYVPADKRRLVPLVGMAAIVLLTLFGARYLPPETVAEVKQAVQTAMVQPTP